MEAVGERALPEAVRGGAFGQRWSDVRAARRVASGGVWPGRMRPPLPEVPRSGHLLTVAAGLADEERVALEDRDWFREDPTPAWKRRWDPAPVVTATRTPTGKVAAVLVTAAAVGASWYWHLFAVPFSSKPQTPPGASGGQPTPANLIRLPSKPGVDVPATVVSRWTVTDRRFGAITVIVPVGETPRQAATVALAERGYQVVP